MDVTVSHPAALDPPSLPDIPDMPANTSLPDTVALPATTVLQSVDVAALYATIRALCSDVAKLTAEVSSLRAAGPRRGPALPQPPPFDGHPGFCARRWLEDFEIWATSSQLDNPGKLTFCFHLLLPAEKSWALSNDVLAGTWETFTATFLAYWDDGHDSIIACDDLRTLAQHSSSLGEYIMQFRTLLLRTGGRMGAADVKDAFVRGLSVPGLVMHLTTGHSHASLNEAITESRQYAAMVAYANRGQSRPASAYKPKAPAMFATRPLTNSKPLNAPPQ